jgi:hypothetical protein
MSPRKNKHHRAAEAAAAFNKKYHTGALLARRPPQ